MVKISYKHQQNRVSLEKKSCNPNEINPNLYLEYAKSVSEIEKGK